MSNTNSLFQENWWLDAVAPGEWERITIERSGTICATFPYVLHKNRGRTLITMPFLTQTLGPWLRPYPGKYANKLSEEKQLLNEIIEKFPQFDYFHQRFHYTITNWLPFFWKNYKQTTRYTYVIEDLFDLDSIYSGFTSAKKKNIKKALGTVKVYQDIPAKAFYENHVLTLSKQGQKIIYPFQLFERIYNSAYERSCGKTFYALDNQNNIHSTIFVVWNEESAYYLISSIDPDFRNSGSATLLIWEAIQYLSNKTEKFDFEGSMIEGVEESFRSFGAVQKPYFEISKYNSLPYQVFTDIRSWISFHK